MYCECGGERRREQGGRGTRVPNHIKWVARNYPFDTQHLTTTVLSCDAILMPKCLDMSWYEAICLSTSGLDIVFKSLSDLAKFMRHTHEDIPLFITQGGVSKTTARVMADSFTMDVPMGAFTYHLGRKHYFRLV
jgi:hypothetical protein